MSVGAILTLGFGQFGSVNLLPTLGYGDSVTPPTPPVSDRGATPGWPLDKRLSWEELDRKLRAQVEAQRIELGITTLPEAQQAVSEAVIAQERAQSSVDIEAKLTAARAQMEAEEMFANVYGSVRGDLERERLSELFRMEVERERLAKRRKAVLMLLLN